MKDYEALKELLFHSKRLMAVPSGHCNNDLLAGTALKNLSDLGFTLDESGVKLLSSASKEDITQWYFDTADKLKALVGGDHEYHPFYPNFPQEVIEKSDYELLIDQLKHYWSAAIDDILGEREGEAWSPEGEKKTTARSLEEHPLRVLETIDGYDTESIENAARYAFKSLLRSKNNLSPDDLQNVINVYMNNVPNWTKDVTVCENRTTLSYLYARALMERQSTENMPSLVTNDYLRIARIASHMRSCADSLSLTNLKEAETAKVIAIPRNMRKFIAMGIDKQKNLEEDVARDKQAWKALLRKIHIGEFESCERANAVAHKLRNNIPLETFYSRIEQAFFSKRYEDVIKMYRSRPGEFVKNFNRMLNVQIEDPAQKISYARQLIEASKDVFARTRPEDLVGFISYLKSRTREERIPIHNVKGKLYVESLSSQERSTMPKYAPIPVATANTFIKLAEQGIVAQIGSGKSMGNVYIEPGMEKMALPKTSTSGTQSLNSYTQGSRLPIETENDEPKNLRFLLWFGKNGEKSGNWDNIIDISAGFFKRNVDGSLSHRMNDDLSWYGGRRNSIPGCYFSGDWIGAGDKGSAEFIDINLQELRKANVSYVLLYVNIYSGPDSFSEANLNFGWQERNDLSEGTHVDLSAVRQYCTLNGDARGIVPVMVDVDAGEIIWTDVLHHRATSSSDMRAVIPNAEMYLDMYGKGDRMDMKRAAELLVEANGGTIVDSPEKANVLFTISPYVDKTEEQIVHTATDQNYWVGAIAPQVVEVEEPTVEREVTQPIDLEERSIADVIATLSDRINDQVIPIRTLRDDMERETFIDDIDEPEV